MCRDQTKVGGFGIVELGESGETFKLTERSA
jgi:hypothetical protein